MFTFLGDVQEALGKIEQYVKLESAFFNTFLAEGMRFSSSLYLMLIWIRVLKFIFQNPIEVAEKRKTSQHFFHVFWRKEQRNNILMDFVSHLSPSVKALLSKKALESANSLTYCLWRQASAMMNSMYSLNVDAWFQMKLTMLVQFLIRFMMKLKDHSHLYWKKLTKRKRNQRNIKC